MSTYFGECDAAGNPSGNIGSDTNQYTLWNNNVIYTAPLSGNLNVDDISFFCNYGTGFPIIRCAVYSADGTVLMAQGTTPVAVLTTADEWKGHLIPADITQYFYLVGGTNYRIIGSTGVGTIKFFYNSGSSDDNEYNATDYATGGFPTPAPTGSVAGPARFLMRCGVSTVGAAFMPRAPYITSQAVNRASTF